MRNTTGHRQVQGEDYGFVMTRDILAQNSQAVFGATKQVSKDKPAKAGWKGALFLAGWGFLIPGVREAPLVKVRPAIHAASGNSGTVQKAGHLAAGEAGLKASCSIRSKALVRRPGQRSAPQ
jgi:hypothetical protein